VQPTVLREADPLLVSTLNARLSMVGHDVLYGRRPADKWHLHSNIQVRLQSYIRPTCAAFQTLRGPDEMR